MTHAPVRFLCVAALLVSACATGPDESGASIDVAAVRTVIAQQNKQFTDAHVTGDVATIDSMFTADARSYPPGAPAAIGLAAIHQLTVEFLKIGVTEFTEETTAFYGNAEYVIDEGVYFLRYGKGETERGKYVNVWKQVDGRWRIQANIWNASPPTG